MKAVEKTTRWHVKNIYNDDEKLILERFRPFVKSLFVSSISSSLQFVA